MESILVFESLQIIVTGVSLLDPANGRPLEVSMKNINFELESELPL
jgi:hypothetical protein